MKRYREVRCPGIGVFGFLAIVICIANSSASDRVALLIGNDAYQNVNPLEQARNDAETIGATLESIGFQVTYSLDASRADMLRTIDQFAEQNAEAGLAVVYFAGHGVEIGGEHFLIPIDCNAQSESSFEYEAVPLGRLLSKMSDHQNCLRVVILDACRDNPFDQKVTRSAGTRGLGARTKPAPKQTLIAYSANTGQVALDGMYTPALLKHLKNTSLRGEEVFYAINNEISEKTSGAQEPAIYITGGRPFSFHGDPSASPELPPSPTHDTTASDSPPVPRVEEPAKPSPPPLTPIIEVTREEVQQALDEWVAAWESKNIVRYGECYGQYFAGSSYSNVSGHKSMTRRAWLEDKGDKFNRADFINVEYRNAQYVVDGETVLISFHQDFSTRYGQGNIYTDTGEKILTLRREGGRLKIVNEKFFPPDVRHAYSDTADDGLYSVISQFIHDWADAWESRSIDRYSGFYSSRFQGHKGTQVLNYNQWMNDMSGKFTKASWISIGMGELDIRQDGEQFVVEYKQSYKASNYSDVGIKRVVLEKTGDNGLAIVTESWRSQ